MNIWLVLTFIFALLEALAVSRNLPKLEHLAKPAVMVYLFLWLYFSTGLRGTAFWFGVGILFSLVGDVLLMNPTNMMFFAGLVTFLFAHIFYIIGLRSELTTSTVWSLILMVLILVNGIRLVRRIIGAMQAKGENALVIPVIVYSLAISLMLYAAMSTLRDPGWKTNAALFVSLGAFLFYLSDMILAWDKFVSPIKNGRLFNIIIYHLGQIGLIAGVISQFS